MEVTVLDLAGHVLLTTFIPRDHGRLPVSVLRTQVKNAVLRKHGENKNIGTIEVSDSKSDVHDRVSLSSNSSPQKPDSDSVLKKSDLEIRLFASKGDSDTILDDVDDSSADLELDDTTLLTQPTALYALQTKKKMQSEVEERRIRQLKREACEDCGRNRCAYDCTRSLCKRCCDKQRSDPEDTFFCVRHAQNLSPWAYRKNIERKIEKDGGWSTPLELVPPWVYLPHGEQGNLFAWRMGEGEYHLHAWQQRYGELSRKERRWYQKQFPEVPGWRGWYGRQEWFRWEEEERFCREAVEDDEDSEKLMSEVGEEKREEDEDCCNDGPEEIARDD